MKEIDEKTGVQKTCANCTYCERNTSYNKKAALFCKGWEEPCCVNVDHPMAECCENWELY